MTKKVRSRPFKALFSFFFFTLFLVVVPKVCLSQSPVAWINEVHYKGSDRDKFVEVVLRDADTFDLSKLKLTMYNGRNGKAEDSYSLNKFTAGEKSGSYTIYSEAIADLKNGPDGLALDYDGRVIQFVSYKNSFTARNGPADGKRSIIINSHDSKTSKQQASLQLAGTGLKYGDFSWTGSSEKTRNRLNQGQLLHPTIQFTVSSSTINESSGSVTIAASISKPDGNPVSIDIKLLPSISSAGSADFIGSQSKTITFARGSSDGDTQQATFAINNDREYEGEEFATFELTHLSTSGSAQVGRPYAYTVTIKDDDEPGVVINEFLSDPSDHELEGDANGDGIYDPAGDQFIELLNTESIPVDISGWILSAKGRDRAFHFPPGTVLKAHSAAVVFGGGMPTGSFGGSLVFISESISLPERDGEITLKDDKDHIVDHYSYGSKGRNEESLVRNPEGSGQFTGHTSVSGSGGELFSPGTKSDGSLFSRSITVQGDAGWRMLSAPAEDLPVSALTDDVPVKGTGSSEDRNFYTGYDGSSFTAPSNLSANLASGKGFLLYFFNSNGEDDDSKYLPVTLDINSASEPSTDVTVNLHHEGDQWNLVGNPFTTPIDISDIGSWTDDNGGKDTLASQVGQIWDDRSESYILTSTKGNKVAPWQGFFIQNSTADKLTIPRDARKGKTRFYKNNDENGYISLILKGEDRSSRAQTVDHAAVLYFDDRAKYGNDAYDASKLSPLTSQYALLSIISGQKEHPSFKAQDSRPYHFNGELSYNLGVTAKDISGDFTISWNKHNIPEAWKIQLVDHETGEEIDMNTEDSYQFTFHAIAQKETGFKSNIEKSLPQVASLDTTVMHDETPRFTIKISNATIAQQSDNTLPESVKLNPNYPNPFNPSTTISYELAEETKVKLSIWNIVGQKVATLVDGTMDAGEHKEIWNAIDMPSGIYIAQLEVEGDVYIRKMTLIK